MFEENKYEESDILMRSILSEAREEVPEHIWEGISAELDKRQTRKPVVLWFRRTAVAAAAAAAVAVGVVLHWDGGAGTMLVPEAEGSGMVAVVEPEATAKPEGQTAAEQLAAITYVADADKAVKAGKEAVRKTVVPSEAEEPETSVAQEVKESAEDAGKKEAAEKKEAAGKKEVKEAAEYFPEVWPEDEDEVRKRNREGVSLVLSGVAGTNNARNGNGNGPFKRPQISTAPPKTGIEEKSTESTYGLPLSAGVGVKIGLTPRWSIGTGVNYTLLTRRFYGTYTHVDGNGIVDVSTGSDIRNIQQYVGVPVNVFYNILDRDHVNFYAYAGGTVEKCISDKYSLMGTSINHSETAKGVQLSANAGVGVEFILGKRLGLYIDPSLRYYFDCGQPKSIRTVQPLMLGFEMGLRVKL